MTTYQEEIEGREFDWYAEDIDGNIGLFSTVGEGFVPDSILANFTSHDEISNSLDSPNWGSPEVWSDFSKLGFYVYDWDLPGGPYIQRGEAVATMSIELKNKVLSIVGVPKLNVRFSKLKVVQGV
ncbi:hypothetical protein [Microbulbifer sp. TYP-18]|uniref:hypothetical protein n=1 Tax=Microbulbifer sp. TYP-18 TaxID=3230024 RepID=UPI0034C5BE31